jgi:hypothetical protein
MACHSAWHGIEECGPATARLELMVRTIEGCIARSTIVRPGGGMVFVVFSREGSFSSLFAEDAELLCPAPVSFLAN